MTRQIAGRLGARLAWAQAMTLALVAGSAGLLGCGGGDEARDPWIGGPELQDESPERAAFVAEVRRAFEAGDARGVERLVNWEGMPPEIVEHGRRMWLPKGPAKVVDVRVVALPAEPLGPLILRGTHYVSNLDVTGVLVLEMLDVSVGKTRVALAFGKRDGRFYLAGLKPRGGDG